MQEKLIKALDEFLLYRTQGKLQELQKVRQEIRNEEMNTIFPQSVLQTVYRASQPASRDLYKHDY